MKKTSVINYQDAMRTAFDEQLSGMLVGYDLSVDEMTSMVGVENEYLLVTADGSLATEEVRDAVLNGCRDIQTSRELGRSQMEIITCPVDVCSGYRGLYDELYMAENVLRSVAQRLGCTLVRIGSYPGASGDILYTQHDDKYRRILEAFDDVLPKTGTTNIGDVGLNDNTTWLMGGCQATQLNIRVRSGDNAVYLLNRAIELSPSFIALSANSPFVNCRPTGYKDIRYVLWEMAYDMSGTMKSTFGVRRRTGIPNNYHENMDAYLDDVRNQPFMICDPDHAFSHQMKMYWRIARLKPCGKNFASSLLEIRCIPIQPTLLEDIAIHMLVYGLLSAYTRKHARRTGFLPINLVNENIYRACKGGLDAKLYCYSDGRIVEADAKEIVSSHIEMAVEEWNQKSKETADLVQSLKGRLSSIANTPADKQLRKYNATISKGDSRSEAARILLMSNVVSSCYRNDSEV
jgi:gamma-glutamyl:cysteine ligase YbdK (ATP-grasp superfamily)